MISVGKGIAIVQYCAAFACLVIGFTFTDTVFQEIAWFALAGALLLAAVVVMLGVIVAHIERLKRT